VQGGGVHSRGISRQSRDLISAKRAMHLLVATTGEPSPAGQ
jgi:hypothetical protein